MLIRRQLKWVGHITRMDNRRLPKQVLFGQLLNAPRKVGGQKLRYKDTVRHNLQNVCIHQDNWKVHQIVQRGRKR